MQIYKADLKKGTSIEIFLRNTDMINCIWMCYSLAYCVANIKLY